MINSLMPGYVGFSENVTAVVVVSVITNDCVTEAAAVKLELPGCDAVTVTVPGPAIVMTLLPLSVATVAGVLPSEYVTGNPELAVAVSVTVPWACATLGSALKVIVWLSDVMVRVPGTKVLKV